MSPKPFLLACALLCTPALAGPGEVAQPRGDQLLYTTWLYTASEVVVHGYAPDTEVSLLDMDGGRTVWKGTVGAGETRLVTTGPGVFGFLADKKAAVLTGTPSSCTAVGYFIRDEEGRHRSDHFYTQLPSSGAGPGDRLILWNVGETTPVTVRDLTTGASLYDATLAAGARFEIGKDQLETLRSHVLDVRASSPDVMVQVYQDEGFTVPATSGRMTGREFVTFVGDITNGVNDLNVATFHADANVSVFDLETEEQLWRGTVEAGRVHTLTMANRYVRVVSDALVSVTVAPYAHYTAEYAEHHLAAGVEGTPIDTDLVTPTTSDLWIFSYYAGNHVTVADASGREVWSGDLDAGHVMGLKPGHGFYRVRASHGVTVTGGAGACGGDYSPSGGMFAIDEALFAAVLDIRRKRVEAAGSRGVTLSDDEIYAPLSATELEEATRAVRKATGNASYSAAEAEQRLETMSTK